MSQEEFAQHYHVTRQIVSNWEKEKNYPDLQTLVQISDESGISLDSMLKDNFSMVQEIDKKVRHLKWFKMGTAIVLVIVFFISSYIGIQKGQQNCLIQTYKSNSEEIGFEEDGNNYYLTDSDFKYEVYMFDRPDIWKLNQKMSEREKFIVATLIENDIDLRDNLDITIRKTKDFITLSLSKGNYIPNDNSLQINEYSLDKNGQIKHQEKMDAADSEIYDQLKDKIASGVKKLNEVNLPFIAK